MHHRFRPWFFVLIAAVVVAVAVLAVRYYRIRDIRSAADLLALLPRGEAVVLYVDAAALRQAGVLNLLSTPQVAEEADYKDFVAATRFDYQKDIDLLAAEMRGEDVFALVRGRFDWKALSHYIASHGGSCHKDSFCSIPSSTPNRWGSLLLIQEGVLGVAVSSDAAAAYGLSPHQERPPVTGLPTQPVWLQLPRSVLEKPTAFPPVLQGLAQALAPANRVVFSLGLDGFSLALQMDARCDTPIQAKLLRERLQQLTGTLKSVVKQPNPADLSGLVVSGTFQQAADHVNGSWPIPKELLNTLGQ